MTNLIDFNPNAIAQKDAGIFGLPFTTASAKQVIIPVPWEVTVSYRAGTALGPQAIYDASAQVDLFDADVENAWKAGLAMDAISEELQALNGKHRVFAEQYISLLEDGETPESNAEMSKLLKQINDACARMNEIVEARAAELIEQGKLVSLIGGDHSTPLGLMRALGKKHEEFGILHIDAHADLRDAYEGFKYSHASIMFNVLEVPSMSKLVQVGIRDYCEEEALLVSDSRGRIVSFYDRDIKESLYDGKSWKSVCTEIVEGLPEKVYVSFDVDGLDPKLCPNTGTPVPGGLEFEQSLYLVREVVRSGRTIIGFDINEVAPGEDEFDAIVGARLLYRIANLAALSNKIV